jgi:hypothetical protein
VQQVAVVERLAAGADIQPGGLVSIELRKKDSD